MRRIVCTGDSHTWGEGATGLKQSFDPPIVPGDLRLAGFAYDSYVNLLRRKWNALTGSSAREWSAKDMSAAAQTEYEAPCTILKDKALDLDFSGELLRIECCGSRSVSTLNVDIDGKAARFDLHAVDGPKDYRLLTFHLEEGAHHAVLSAKAGTVRLYRAESYEGPWAVINSGVGSTTASLYHRRCWPDYVEALNPDILLMEAHTINDWLTMKDPVQYENDLSALLQAGKARNSAVILMTVCPLVGKQTVADCTIAYDAYLEASRRAAQAMEVPLCDASMAMAKEIAGMKDEEAAAWLYADRKHVNDRGHALYADLLYDALYKEMFGASHPNL